MVQKYTTRKGRQRRIKGNADEGVVEEVGQLVGFSVVTWMRNRSPGRAGGFH